jgi:hypothetical protein
VFAIVRGQFVGLICVAAGFAAWWLVASLSISLIRYLLRRRGGAANSDVADSRPLDAARLLNRTRAGEFGAPPVPKSRIAWILRDGVLRQNGSFFGWRSILGHSVEIDGPRSQAIVVRVAKRPIPSSFVGPRAALVFAPFVLLAVANIVCAMFCFDRLGVRFDAIAEAAFAAGYAIVAVSVARSCLTDPTKSYNEFTLSPVGDRISLSELANLFAANCPVRDNLRNE